MLVESVSRSSAISGCVKICTEVKERIDLTSALSPKEVIDPVLLASSFLIYPSLKHVFEKLLNAGKQHVLGSHLSLPRKGK